MLADDWLVSIGASSSVSSSIQFAIQSAGNYMSDAASAISTDDGDGYVNASVDMVKAKMSMGVAAAMSRAQDEMMGSTLSMLA